MARREETRTPSAAASPAEKVLDGIRERLVHDLSGGSVRQMRGDALGDALAAMEAIISDPSDDLAALSAKIAKTRAAMKGLIGSCRELSHGLPRPPSGSRRAELLDLWWNIRRFLLEQLSAGGLGEQESAELQTLVMNADQLDRRIIQCGTEDACPELESESLRPFTLRIRQFAAAMNCCLAFPIWRTAAPATNPNGIFFSGRREIRNAVKHTCAHRGLTLLDPTLAAEIAESRWQALAACHAGIFDLGSADPRERCATLYEIGVAQTLGKAVLVVTEPGASPPFDIDVPPVVCDSGDIEFLARPLDDLLYSVRPRPHESGLEGTVRFALAHAATLPQTIYVDQACKLVERAAANVDPLGIRAALETLRSFAGERAPALLYPAWRPLYPEEGARRLFHVMPFGPAWAQDAMASASEACQAEGFTYVRGDMPLERNIIRSIWDEICSASHVLVDLTDANANVSFELGIADTLGRERLIVGQEGVVASLFAAVAKERVIEYSRDARGAGSLRSVVSRWLKRRGGRCAG